VLGLNLHGAGRLLIGLTCCYLCLVEWEMLVLRKR
jgi:hypothetical protein